MISRLKAIFRAHPVSETELGAFVDGRVPPDRLVALQAHIESCAQCAARVADLRSLKSLLASLPQERPQRPLTLSPAMAAAPTTAARQRPSAPIWAPALALSVLVLLLAVDIVGPASSSSRQASDASLATSQQKSTAAGAESGAFSNAAAPTIPPPRTGDASAAPVAPQPQTAAGAAAQAASPAAAAQASSPPAAADSARAAAAPTVAAPATHTTPSAESGSSWSVLRVLEVLAGVAFLISLAYAWRRRRAGPA